MGKEGGNQPTRFEQHARQIARDFAPQGDVFVAHAGNSRPCMLVAEHRGQPKDVRPSMPRSRREREAVLNELYRTEVHLPSVSLRDLDPDEEAEITTRIATLSYKELGRAIRDRQDELDGDLMQQWPRGLAIP